jgi:hypothetical protein
MFDGGGGALISGFVSLGLLMAIVAVIAGRHLPDQTATRPRAIYLSVAMLPVLVIGTLAAAAFLEALIQLVLGPESKGEAVSDLIGGLTRGGDAGMGGLGSLLTGMGGGFDPTDATIRTLVAAGITAVVALAIYRIHQSWRDELTYDGGFVGTAAARVLQAFAYTAVLIFVVLFAVSVVKAGYGVFRIVAPDTSALLSFSDTAERERGIADVVSGLALAGASWWLFQMHWKLAATWRGETATQAPPEPPPAA